jgi:phospholipid/cholesterol/gamma-HCH transport system permease protein
MRSASAAQALPAIAFGGDAEHAVLEGVLDIRTLIDARRALAERWGASPAAGGPANGPRSIDVSGLTALDTPGALFLCDLRTRDVRLTGIRGEHQALIDLVSGLDGEPLPPRRVMSRWRQLVAAIGEGAHETVRDTYDIVAFIGRTASAIVDAILHPRIIHIGSISRHISDTGINALPIVGLLAVMISIVIAYQGIVQLRPYGGAALTVNLVAVSVLREMGVLITAIIVASRSGSAFAAEIGVMQARDEVAALEAMGLDPMQMLVLPRVVALVLTLPLLTFFADVMGIAGGAAIMQLWLDVSLPQYFDRVLLAVDMGDLAVGIIKAPVFATIIAIIGCMHGLRVRGSAESVGRETTRAVVKTIFIVIVLDALFSVFFERIGL